MRVLPRVTKSISLGYFKIAKNHFQSLIYAWSHLISLIFNNCLIGTEGLEFNKNLEFKVKELSLNFWGSVSIDDWGENPHYFKNLIFALSQSTIQKSLKTISCLLNFDVEIFEDIISQSHFKKQKITLNNHRIIQN